MQHLHDSTSSSVMVCYTCFSYAQVQVPDLQGRCHACTGHAYMHTLVQQLFARMQSELQEAFTTERGVNRQYEISF